MRNSSKLRRVCKSILASEETSQTKRYSMSSMFSIQVAMASKRCAYTTWLSA